MVSRKVTFSIEYIVCVFQLNTGKGTSEVTQNARFVLKGLIPGDEKWRDLAAVVHYLASAKYIEWKEINHLLTGTPTEWARGDYISLSRTAQRTLHKVLGDSLSKEEMISLVTPVTGMR